MPIELITGLPGHAKTLFAITRYRDIAEKTKRPIYYSGITDLKLPWTEFDPKLWETLPPGSILIIDEAQKLLPLRGRGVPDKWIENFTTHRHLGIDIVLITQHPMLLDSFVRRLVDHQYHVVRMFGLKASNIYENPNGYWIDSAKRAGGIVSKWVYPKDVFNLYTSAELHTVKARVPVRVWLLLILPLVFGALVYVAWLRLNPQAQADRVTLSGGGVVAAPGAVAAPGPAVAPGRGYPSDTRPGGDGPGYIDVVTFLDMQTPRIDGLAHTAPAYDEVTRPAVAPYPAACVQTATRCQCYTTQATRLDTPAALCASIVAGGFFVPWRSAVERVERPAPVVVAGGPALPGALGIYGAPPSSLAGAIGGTSSGASSGQAGARSAARGAGGNSGSL